MKPEPQAAMNQLIEQVREAIPFGLSEAEICSGECIGCAKKLMEFLDQELEDWSTRLDQGEVPKLGDLSKLAKSSTKIHRVLTKNNLV
ncbi:hypothetical protein EOPP23_03335 [Endozoicomonas sp. OPT23]|uniref:hypothetical protein n=1 Tax=Endozoicomonas sp. OPT23 TaxID=2072845 RepID=UPI00129BB98D|nr:hypothetical protein [Endozoicomonas sp. OPT23]MRI32032.1 hypothetical protein [Endozoicomonas sp. OPT23]